MHKYRPEIDGLRAVAVIAVLLFHAQLGLPGGYVGVDVFFVISGFLITALILKAIRSGEFRSLDFWERRVRRIAPAMVVTVLAIVVAAWFIYLPNDYQRVGNAVVAQSAFISNVYHWKASGYFGPGVDTLPLLHTWSLAVEEQFYIILPLILIGIAKWKPQWLNGFLIAIFIGSLALGLIGTPKNPDAAFYLLPTRAWELLMGSLLAIYPQIGKNAAKGVRELIGWLGLGAIALSIFTFDAQTPFPGYAALLPCLGSAAFIWANTEGLTSSGKLLALSPAVFVGKISYSLYLIHWPVLVFTLYWHRDEMTLERKVFTVGLILALSVLSWAIVETPIRKRQILKGRKPLFAGAFGAIALLAVLGLAIRFKHGFPSRFDAQVLKYSDARSDVGFLSDLSVADAQEGKFKSIGAESGPVVCMVWGDSHAMAITPAVDLLCKENKVKGLQATHAETSPILDFVPKGKFSLRSDAPAFNEAVVNYAVSHRIKFIVMTGVWANYQVEPNFEQGLIKTVQTLKNGGVTPVIMADVALQKEDVPWLLARAALRKEDPSKIGVTIQSQTERNTEADRVFAKLSALGAKIVQPGDRLIDKSGLWRAEYDGVSMYRDASHLSVQGAYYLKPLFQPMFSEMSQTHTTP